MTRMSWNSDSVEHEYDGKSKCCWWWVGSRSYRVYISSGPWAISSISKVLKWAHAFFYPDFIRLEDANLFIFSIFHIRLPTIFILDHPSLFSSDMMDEASFSNYPDNNRRYVSSSTMQRRARTNEDPESEKRRKIKNNFSRLVRSERSQMKTMWHCGAPEILSPVAIINGPFFCPQRTTCNLISSLRWSGHGKWD